MSEKLKEEEAALLKEWGDARFELSRLPVSPMGLYIAASERVSRAERAYLNWREGQAP